jgi:L-alanine-DL-glutamate epimerase-like enolase superfamily enzyme
MIHQILIQKINIPFRVVFKHNAASRSETESILVIIQSGDNKGYGEGCPRSYVTHETINSCFHFFKKISKSFQESVKDFTSLLDFANQNSIIIDENPAAWCAIETAFLDLYGKIKHQSIDKVLGLSNINDHFECTAVIVDGSMESFNKYIQEHLHFKFQEFKIKISGNSELDYPKLMLLKQKCPNSSIRLDANNLWESEQSAIDYIQNLPVPVIAIEEPLISKNAQELISLSKKISIPIILDESVIRKQHLEPFINHSSSFWINLRVSKMGGILRSIELGKMATEHQFNLIIGSQVGESSILCRLALLLAAQFPKRKGFEGGYGTLLLQEDVTDSPIQFNSKGYIDWNTEENTDKFGIQVEIKSKFQ